MAHDPRSLQRKETGIRSNIWLPIVLLASLFFGLFGLPRLGTQSHGGAGQLANDFSLPIVAGGDPRDRVSLQAHRGKIVVLDFWATWCGPCAEQTKILERFVSVPRPELVVVGVNEGESIELLRSYFARQSAPAYPIVSDSDEQVGSSFGVRGLPTLVVIDKEGRIASSTSGVVPYGRLERLIAEASGR